MGKRTRLPHLGHIPAYALPSLVLYMYLYTLQHLKWTPSALLGRLSAGFPEVKSCMEPITYQVWVFGIDHYILLRRIRTGTWNRRLSLAVIYFRKPWYKSPCVKAVSMFPPGIMGANVVMQKKHMYVRSIISHYIIFIPAVQPGHLGCSTAQYTLLSTMYSMTPSGSRYVQGMPLEKYFLSKEELSAHCGEGRAVIGTSAIAAGGVIP